VVQLPLTTLGQETRWAYSTTTPSPHGAATMWFCLRDLMFSHFSKTPTCDRQTDEDRAKAYTALAAGMVKINTTQKTQSQLPNFKGPTHIMPNCVCLLCLHQQYG